MTEEDAVWLSNTDSLLDRLSNAEGLVLIDADTFLETAVEKETLRLAATASL